MYEVVPDTLSYTVAQSIYDLCPEAIKRTASRITNIEVRTWIKEVYSTASDSALTNPYRHWTDSVASMLAMKRACRLDYLCVRASCHREVRREPAWYGNSQFPLQREKLRSQLCPQIMSHGLLGCQRRPGGLPPQRRDIVSSSFLQRGGQAERRCSKRAWNINVGFTILCTTALRDPIHQKCCSMSEAIPRGIAGTFDLQAYGPVNRSVAGQWL